VELIDTAAEGGVGVEHLAVHLEEGTDAGPVAALSLGPGHLRLSQLGLAAEEDLDRCHPVIDRGVKVVVEVAAG
jgi:hypothetical protein